MADLMLAEVEDLFSVLAPVLTPMKRAIGVLRYPAKPLCITFERLGVAVLSYLKIKMTHSSRKYSKWIVLPSATNVYHDQVWVSTRGKSNGHIVDKSKKRVPYRERGPVNWHGALLHKDVLPIINAWKTAYGKNLLLRAYALSVALSTRTTSWKWSRYLHARGPIGTQHAKPISFAERGYREQYCYQAN